MKFMWRWLAWLMRPVEEIMISRLLRQRDEAWLEAAAARHALKRGQFDVLAPWKHRLRYLLALPVGVLFVLTFMLAQLGHRRMH